ncbi:SDR family oxidoreductase [Thalassobaculum sp.]|uniref:SDR family NAD(P)-dependent oxidoreductase n=1 Tax=Thalassobaculum sp. TaxID=2022740 RepID=UPI0032EC8B4B
MPAQNRVALITGGGGGIGEALCAAIAAAGTRVAVVDQDESAALRVAQALGDQAVAIAGDISTESGCAAAVRATEQRLGPVDILVNNAGIGLSALRPDGERNLPDLQEVTPEIFDRFIAVNLRGPFLLTRLVTPGMRERAWGRVINNTTSFFTMLRTFPYGALKASLEAASAVWATELEGTGVTVNVLVPGGPTDTAFIGDGSGMDRATMLRPEVMGPPAAWLASPGSDGFTGKRIIAAYWDPALDADAAVAKAAMPIGWPELAQATRVWPKAVD